MDPEGILKGSTTAVRIPKAIARITTSVFVNAINSPNRLVFLGSSDIPQGIRGRFGKVNARSLFGLIKSRFYLPGVRELRSSLKRPSPVPGKSCNNDLEATGLIKSP